MRRLTHRLLGVSLFGSDIRAHEVDVTDAVPTLGCCSSAASSTWSLATPPDSSPTRCRCRRGLPAAGRWPPHSPEGSELAESMCQISIIKLTTKMVNLNEYNTNTSKQNYADLNTIEIE